MTMPASQTRYVFFATTADAGREVWVTDGTEAGTVMLKDIGPGTNNLGDNGRLMPLPDGRMMFLGNDGNGDRLWVTDGTQAGTVILTDIPAGFINDYFAMADGRLLFQMFSSSDAELWITDGTAAGTVLLKDINPSNSGSYPSGFTALSDGRIIFSANDGAHGSEVWVTDGTPDGTMLVKDIATGAGGWNGDGASSGPAFFTALGDGRLVFRAEDGVNGNELWVTDGTEAGTQLLKDITPGAGDSYMTQPATMPDGRVLFSADMGGSVGRELWVTDGTTAGTVLVKDINTGSAGSSLGNFTALSDGRMVFSATTTATGYELWVTDGTANGTVLLKDINSGTANSYPSDFTSMPDGRLLFSAADAGHGSELWVTDGTVSGTVMLMDTVPGTGNFYPQNFTVLEDGRISFMATTDGTGFELWITDGTPGGTYQVKDINPGLAASQPSRLYAVTAPINAAPTGEPDVAGTAAQGQVLTASPGTLADADGLDTAAVAYRWQRESTPGQFDDIPGAAGATYTLTQDDVGHRVRVVASYTDSGATDESVAGAPTVAVANVNDAPGGAPAVIGTPEQGTVLSAGIGTLADADGLDGASIAYRWQREAGAGQFADIPGAAGATYTLTQEDVGHRIRVVASYTDGFGQAESADGVPTVPVANVNDAPTGAPVATGMLAQGAVLSAGIGTLADADGLDGASITYRWQRDDGQGGYADIAAATGSQYTLTQADVGHAVRAVASYMDDLGMAEEVAGTPTAAVANVNDAPQGGPVVTGLPEEGAVLTAGIGTLADPDGLDAADIAYRWQRETAPGQFTDIAGATGTQYTLTQADLGHALRVVATYTDGFGQVETAPGNPTAPIANINDAPQGAPAVTGSLEQGAVLLAGIGTLTDADGLDGASIAYHWQRSDGHGGWAAIDGADQDRYALTSADVGHTIRVAAHYTDLQGSAETVASAPTAKITDNNALVDDAWYLAQYGDVLAAGMDAETHYARYGWKEGRDPNGYFSTSGYLSANADVRAAGIDPLEHYLANGWQEGRDPTAGFDNETYLARNPDVAAQGINPLQHFLTYGQDEGRKAGPAIGTAIVDGFDAEYYLLSNPEIGFSGLDAREHWNAYGWREGRDPNALFDTSAYLERYADVAEVGMDPLMHYMQFGAAEGRIPGTFDAAAYLHDNPDVAALGADAMTHYLMYGAKEGRDAIFIES